MMTKLLPWRFQAWLTDKARDKALQAAMKALLKALKSV